MGKENPVLVLASGDDPQFAMLNELPHTICGEANDRVTIDIRE